MYLISYKTYYKLNIMIEKSLYENYQIDFDETITPDSEDYLFVFNKNRELYLDDDKKLPKSLDNFDINFCLYIGTYCDKKAFAAHVETEEEYCNLADVYEFNHDLYHIASRAVLVNDWYNIFQYCGHCGAKNVIDEKDMMMKCLECGQVHYPRIAPAIIVAITKDDKLLMARHSYHKNHPYTIIAGFVEPGENLEEANLFFLEHKNFLEELHNCPKHKQFLQTLPVSLLTVKEPGLFGAAVYAQQATN